MSSLTEALERITVASGFRFNNKGMGLEEVERRLSFFHFGYQMKLMNIINGQGRLLEIVALMIGMVLTIIVQLINAH